MRATRVYGRIKLMLMTRAMLILAAMLAASLVTGCKVGPNYKTAVGCDSQHVSRLQPKSASRGASGLVR